MDSAHVLDRERAYLSRAPIHEPFEPVDDSQHIRSSENTADRGRADDTIDSRSRAATDKNTDRRTLFCHRLLPRLCLIEPYLFFISGMVVYSVSSGDKRDSG